MSTEYFLHSADNVAVGHSRVCSNLDSAASQCVTPGRLSYPSVTQFSYLKNGAIRRLCLMTVVGRILGGNGDTVPRRQKVFDKRQL